MHIGVPKEIKSHEYRVGLTPEAVREYAARGHRVLLERGAGARAGWSDDDYVRAGAQIAAGAADVYARADMIVKVKEPQPPEWRLLREGQILFAYLHLAAEPELARALMQSGCTAIAYETVTDAQGTLPLLAPMSEVAGRLAIEAAGSSLRSNTGGRGILLGGVPGVLPARVVILGCGVVGTQAARMAVGLGANVTLLDKSLPRLRALDELFQGRARTCVSTLEAIEREIAAADVVIGAVLVQGASAPKLVTRAMLKTMQRGAVVVDVAIDQGGCFETSRPTTHEKPTFEIDGIIHYCVTNMPGVVPLTSSQALSHATLRYGLTLADDGLSALATDPHLAAGLNVHRGQITHPAVAASLGSAYVDPARALAPARHALGADAVA